MKKTMNSKAILILLCVFTLEACQRVPITGRRQLNLVGESTLMGMASAQYVDFLQIDFGDHIKTGHGYSPFSGMD